MWLGNRGHFWKLAFQLMGLCMAWCVWNFSWLLAEIMCWLRILLADGEHGELISCCIIEGYLDNGHMELMSLVLEAENQLVLDLHHHSSYCWQGFVSNYRFILVYTHTYHKVSQYQDTSSEATTWEWMCLAWNSNRLMWCLQLSRYQQQKPLVYSETTTVWWQANSLCAEHVSAKASSYESLVRF